MSYDEVFTRINTLSWDAYHESGDLIKQVEAYRELYGNYPELVQIDKIFATRENRKWLRERDLQISALLLGQKPIKIRENYYQRNKARKEAAEINFIEGRFGQGKNGYSLNEIRARLKESWVAFIFLIINLIHIELSSSANQR